MTLSVCVHLQTEDARRALLYMKRSNKRTRDDKSDDRCGKCAATENNCRTITRLFEEEARIKIEKYKAKT